VWGLWARKSQYGWRFEQREKERKRVVEGWERLPLLLFLVVCNGPFTGTTTQPSYPSIRPRTLHPLSDTHDSAS
jgi:hypothetical protein